MKALNLILLTVFVSAAAQSAPARYSPRALDAVVAAVQQLTAQRKQAVVVFDLDDTTINTRERTLRILRDFIQSPGVAAAFPFETRQVANLGIERIRFQLADTLKSVGVTNAAFVQRANDFWGARFFTNEYCARDVQIPGAAEYLHRLARAGAKIIYLTGRDQPRMGQGTAYNLRRNFFPAETFGAVLMLKPDPRMDDLVFKQQALAQIAAMGDVVGVFENEPANLNAMAAAFPSALAVFLDTIHSPKPDQPVARAHWVRGFLP